MKQEEIKIQIREADSNDRHVLLEFKGIYLFNYFNSYFSSWERKLVDALFGRKYKLFVPEINGQIVGCVGFVKHSLYRDIYYCSDFFVLPQFRGLNVGKKLCTGGYELLDHGGKTKFYTRVEANNFASKKVFEGLGNRPFRFNISYSVYKPNDEFERKYGIKDLGFAFLKWRTTNHLHSILKEIVGGEYLDFFNKTNRFNFLFPNQNYREIIALLIKWILKMTKCRTLLITDRNEIIGYALNFGNQNQIYLAPSVIDNQSIVNCNQALYDYLRPSDRLENYYHLRRETISELTYSGGNSRQIEVLYKNYQSLE